MLRNQKHYTDELVLLTTLLSQNKRLRSFHVRVRFVDRRSVRSAHIKRSENLTCARSDSDSRVAATRRVRLTDAFTTVPLSAHGEHLAATVTRAQCRKQTGGEGVRGGSAVGQPTSLIFASYRWSLCVLPPRLHSHGLLYNRCYYIGVHGTAYAKSNFCIMSARHERSTLKSAYLFEGTCSCRRCVHACNAVFTLYSIN